MLFFELQSITLHSLDCVVPDIYNEENEVNMMLVQQHTKPHLSAAVADSHLPTHSQQLDEAVW